MFLADLGLLWFAGLVFVGSIVGSAPLAAIILYAMSLGFTVLCVLAGERMTRLRKHKPYG